MTGQDTFSGYHPAINFLFFGGAFICGMIFMHPAFLGCAVFLSALYYLTIKRRAGLRYLAGMLVFFAVLSALNPLFNIYGEKILFTYWRNRPYTWEALCYGMALAAMMVSILIWFTSYQIVMTSDKFLFLFGRIIPSASLIFTMILRLIPSYRRKIAQVAGARKGIGKAPQEGTFSERADHSFTILSALTSWALESGILTADSMRSRGYGTGRRTCFSVYRFEGRDRLLLGFMSILLAIIAVCAFLGGARVEYTPYLRGVSGGPCFYTCLGAYFIFLAIPSVINITEEIIWHNLRSGI